jgi:hypothetical protein
MASPTTINQSSVAGRLLAWNRCNADTTAGNMAAATALRRAALPGLVEACEKVRSEPSSIKKLRVGLAAEVVNCLADDREFDVLASIAQIDTRRTVIYRLDDVLARFDDGGGAKRQVITTNSPAKQLVAPIGYGADVIETVVLNLYQYDADCLINWINAGSKRSQKAILSALLDSDSLNEAGYYGDEDDLQSFRVLAAISCAVLEGRIATGGLSGVAPTSRRPGRINCLGAWIAWQAWSGAVTVAFLESVLIRKDYWPEPYESERLVEWLTEKNRQFAPDALAMLKTSHDPVLLEVAVDRGLLTNDNLAGLLKSCDVDTLLRVVDRAVDSGRYQGPFKILIARMRTLSRSDMNQVVEWICDGWSEVLPNLRLRCDELELLLCSLSVGFAEEWSRGTWKTPATHKNIERIARALIAEPQRVRELIESGGWGGDFDLNCPLGLTLVPMLPGLVDAVYSGSYHWAEGMVFESMFDAFKDDQVAWEIGLSLAMGWSGTLDDYLATVATLRAQS